MRRLCIAARTVPSLNFTLARFINMARVTSHVPSASCTMTLRACSLRATSWGCNSFGRPTGAATRPDMASLMVR